MTVSGPFGQFTTEAVVDPHATFTTVPAAALIELGVQPHRVVRVKAGDGRAQFRQLGRALTTINGVEDIAPVAFGEPDELAVVGAVTLAVLLLEVDEGSGTLVAVEARGT
jgi:predicted aspartyl protease